MSTLPVTNNNNDDDEPNAVDTRSSRSQETIINLHDTTQDNTTNTTGDDVRAIAAAIVNAATIPAVQQDNVQVKSLQNSQNNSVIAQTSLRTNFKKSNTCGSLFAQCACDDSSECISENSGGLSFSATSRSSKLFSCSVESSSIETNNLQNSANHSLNRSISEPKSRQDSNENNSGSRRAVRKLYQSYSHPDAANLVFTDENKLPKTSSSSDKGSRSYTCPKTGKYLPNLIRNPNITHRAIGCDCLTFQFSSNLYNFIFKPKKNFLITLTSTT